MGINLREIIPRKEITLESLSNKATKALFYCNPNNPTGTIFSETNSRALCDLAQKHNLLIITDEVYKDFYYSDDKHFTPALLPQVRERVIRVCSFSKAFAMTGWRLAYVAAPQHLKPIVEEMTKIQQYTFVCAPAPFQQAAIAAMDFDISSYMADYKTKRDILYDGLKGKFEMTKSAGAFYAFIKAPTKTSTEFVEKAIKNNVLIIPGNVFSEKDTHFRLCFTTTNDKLKQGAEILRNLV